MSETLLASVIAPIDNEETTLPEPLERLRRAPLCKQTASMRLGD